MLMPLTCRFVQGSAAVCVLQMTPGGVRWSLTCWAPAVHSHTYSATSLTALDGHQQQLIFDLMCQTYLAMDRQ